MRLRTRQRLFSGPKHFNFSCWCSILKINNAESFPSVDVLVPDVSLHVIHLCTIRITDIFHGSLNVPSLRKPSNQGPVQPPLLMIPRRCVAVVTEISWVLL